MAARPTLAGDVARGIGEGKEMGLKTNSATAYRIILSVREIKEVYLIQASRQFVIIHQRNSSCCDPELVWAIFNTHSCTLLVFLIIST